MGCLLDVGFGLLGFIFLGGVNCGGGVLKRKR